MNSAKWFGLVVALLICLPASVSAQTSATDQRPSDATALDQIAFVHGGTGPFAVAGYRIGQRALKEMRLPRGTFTFEVITRLREKSNSVVLRTEFRRPPGSVLES